MSDDLRLPITIQTIPEALAFWAERTPEAPALRAIDGRAFSHRELLRATAAVARRLRSLGVAPGDRVAVVVPPGFDACVAMLGAMVGAVAVPFHHDATAYELTRDLGRLPARLVVIGGARAAVARDVAALANIATAAVDELTIGDEAEPIAGNEPRGVTPHCTAAILHTSGTTGLPKRVPRTHRSLVAGSRAAWTRTGLASDDVCLLTSGLTNISGLGNLLNAVLSGGSCIVAPALDPAAFPSWLEELQPTWTFLTPSQLRFLLDTTAGRDRIAGERSRLRLVRAGTQPLPPATRARAEQRLRAVILDTYGMSEAHSITAAGPAATDRRDGSVGRALAVSLRVVDEAGAEVAPGTRGAIVVRGPTVFAGYLDDARETATAFTPDGWFRTGDEGYLDEDGFLYVTGRFKEQINRGGEQIAPAELDLVLQGHPAVAQAAVFGVPDARLGEDIVAAVVLGPGQSTPARALRLWLLDRITPSRVPRRIWFVEDLPRTASGKVRRGELARRWREEQQ